MPGSTFNRNRAALALAEAVYFGKKRAAERFGVSTSSIARWEKLLATDAELEGLYAQALDRMDSGWARDCERALREVVRKIEDVVRSTDATIQDLPDLLSAARTLGELRITQQAVEQDADPRQDRSHAPSATNGPGAPTSIH